MARTPDITLLFGVAGGGSVSGESGKLIASQLTSIMGSINKNPLNIKVQLDQSSLKTMQSQIQSMAQSASVTSTAGLSSALRAGAKTAGAQNSMANQAAIDSVIKRYEAIMGTMQKSKLNWTALDQTNAGTLNGIISQLEQVRTQYNANAISLEEYRAGIIRAEANFASFKNSLIETGQASALLKGGSAEQAAALAKVEQALLTATNAQKNFTAASNPSSKSHSSYTALSKYIAQLQELKTNLESGTMSQQRFAQAFSPLNSGIKTSVSSIKMAGEATSSWSARLTALAKKFTTWFSMTTVIMRIYQSIRKMITSVIDLDAAMTELKKVTNETDAVYNKFLTNASERAKNLGASLKDVVSATADFSRLGYSISEAEKMADAALIYKTVGDGIEDINEASDSIVATMQAFGIGAEDAMSIVDKFNNVGRILPTYAAMHRKEK